MKWCEENARKGTGYGVCGRLMTSHGECDRAADHVPTDEVPRRTAPPAAEDRPKIKTMGHTFADGYVVVAAFDPSHADRDEVPPQREHVVLARNGEDYVVASAIYRPGVGYGPELMGVGRQYFPRPSGVAHGLVTALDRFARECDNRAPYWYPPD